VSSSRPVPLAQLGIASLIGFLLWFILTFKVWNLQDCQTESDLPPIGENGEGDLDAHFKS
jgi:hypothetical protein